MVHEPPDQVTRHHFPLNLAKRRSNAAIAVPPLYSVLLARINIWPSVKYQEITDKAVKSSLGIEKYAGLISKPQLGEQQLL